MVEQAAPLLDGTWNQAISDASYVRVYLTVKLASLMASLRMLSDKLPLTNCGRVKQELSAGNAQIYSRNIKHCSLQIKLHP